MDMTQERIFANMDSNGVKSGVKLFIGDTNILGVAEVENVKFGVWTSHEK